MILRSAVVCLSAFLGAFGDAGAVTPEGAACRRARYETFGKYVQTSGSTQRDISRELKRASKSVSRNLGERGSVTLYYPPALDAASVETLTASLAALYEPGTSILGDVPRVDLIVYVVQLRRVPESFRIELRVPTTATRRYIGFLVLQSGAAPDPAEVAVFSHELMHEWLNIPHHGDSSVEREYARWFIEGMCELAQSDYLRSSSALAFRLFEEQHTTAGVEAAAHGVRLAPWPSRQLEGLASLEAARYEWQRQALSFLVVRWIRDRLDVNALRQIVDRLRGFPRSDSELDEALVSVTSHRLSELQGLAVSDMPSAEPAHPVSD